MTFALVGERVPLKLSLIPSGSTQSGSIILKGGFLEGKSRPEISLLPGNDGESSTPHEILAF